MSRINDLIKKHCPDGVEFKLLGELGQFYGGLSGKTKSDFGNGNAKFVTYMNVFSNIAIDIDVKNFVKIGENEKQHKIQYGDVLFTSSSEKVDECGMSSVLTQKSEEPLYLNSFCFGFRLHDMDLFFPEFLKYLFRDEKIRKQIRKTANGVTRFNISKKYFAKVRIPIPPLPVQQEIVDILDSFTKLEAELEAKLEAELEARQKQYTYYQNALLNFDEGSLNPLQKLIAQHCPDGVEYKELQEIFEIKNGYTPSRSNKKFWIDGTVPWFRMDDIRKNGKILSESLQKITEEAVKGGRPFQANSIIIATSATIGEHALITVPHLSNQRFTSLSLKPEFSLKLNMRFVYYYCFVLDNWCLANTTKSSFSSVNMAGFKRFKFPIPPLTLQKEIVAILNKFDTLVNDISSGLPAEIAARRKQYEHYRTQLLTFKSIQEAA